MLSTTINTSSISKVQSKNIDQIDVSTKTIIAQSNIGINLDTFFKYIPITTYNPIEKKRGRKKKSLVEQEPQLLEEGSIITLQKGNNHKGVILKKKRQGSKTFFLHSVSVVMSIEQNKFINIKVSSNGNFQITGCKNDDQCFKTISLLYKHIKNVELIIGENICVYKNNENYLEVVFDTVMQNMDFNIGFDISREKLNTFINNETNFTSIFEGSIGTGVNIKIESRYPYEENLTKMRIYYNSDDSNMNITFDKIINKDFIENELMIDPNYDENEYEYTQYELEQIKKIKDNNEKSQQIDSKDKKNKKEKYHTFLVFASGSIIMSSRGPIMKEIFKELVELLLENKDQIVESIKK